MQEENEPLQSVQEESESPESIQKESKMHQFLKPIIDVEMSASELMCQEVKILAEILLEDVDSKNKTTNILKSLLKFKVNKANLELKSIGSVKAIIDNGYVFSKEMRDHLNLMKLMISSISTSYHAHDKLLNKIAEVIRMDRMDDDRKVGIIASLII